MNMSSLTHKAMLFSISAHDEQIRRYTGEPYWKHCAEVAAIVQTTSDCSEEMIAAAWLHDVLEDTDHTAEEIRMKFGDDVAAMVEALTDTPTWSGHNRATRKAIDRERLARASPQVQTIKLADLISNTASIVKHDPGFARLYLKEKAALLEVMHSGDRALYNMAKASIKQ